MRKRGRKEVGEGAVLCNAEHKEDLQKVLKMAQKVESKPMCLKGSRKVELLAAKWSAGARWSFAVQLGGVL